MRPLGQPQPQPPGRRRCQLLQLRGLVSALGGPLLTVTRHVTRSRSGARLLRMRGACAWRGGAGGGAEPRLTAPPGSVQYRFRIVRSLLCSVSRRRTIVNMYQGPQPVLTPQRDSWQHLYGNSNLFITRLSLTVVNKSPPLCRLRPAFTHSRRPGRQWHTYST